jgi:UPF0716 family protein affecting phage T7 exclusion
MRLLKLIAIGLLAWPAAEFVAFICVWAAVGFANAVFLLLLMSFAGVFVLRHFGRDVTRLRPAGVADMATASLGRGRMGPGLGGILLLIPGFITSLLGLVMLFPVARRWLLAGCWRLLASPRRPAHPNVVDLAPNEWRALPSPGLPPTSSALKK